MAIWADARVALLIDKSLILLQNWAREGGQLANAYRIIRFFLRMDTSRINRFAFSSPQFMRVRSITDSLAREEP